MGQATIDDLEELILETNEDPHPIYVSTMLTPDEEKKYFHLLSEYKDLFTWSYKEMSGLNPKVAAQLGHRERYFA